MTRDLTSESLYRARDYEGFGLLEGGGRGVALGEGLEGKGGKGGKGVLEWGKEIAGDDTMLPTLINLTKDDDARESGFGVAWDGWVVDE